MPFDQSIIELDCSAVRQELVNWMDGDIHPALRARIDAHLSHCAHCTAIYDGARNVVRLVGAKGCLELPVDLSRRLYQKLLRK